MLREKVTENGWKFILYNELDNFYNRNKTKREIDNKSFAKLMKLPKAEKDTQSKIMGFIEESD